MGGLGGGGAVAYTGRDGASHGRHAHLNPVHGWRVKAIVYDRYGSPDVLELRDVEKPKLREKDLLIRVRAAAIGAGDWHLLTADMPAVRLYQGLFKPKRPILGHEAAGTVEAVGNKVTRVKPGDTVFGMSDAGAFAEYVRIEEKAVMAKPANLSLEQAAAAPVSGLTALQGLRHGQIRSGQNVLVNGASGGVGTFAVQIARAYDTHVTAVCSAAKMEKVRALGANHLYDYRRDDFTTHHGRYDLVLDVVGDRPLADCKRTLTPTGIYVAVSGPIRRSLWIGMTGGRRMKTFISMAKTEDLHDLTELLASGRVTPLVDRRFPLEQVPDALRYFGEHRATGKIVITMGNA